MSKAEQMIPVYYANRSLRGKPACWVTLEYARAEVAAFLARWVNRCKAIQLVKTQAEMHRAAPSLTMGPSVVEKAIDGSRYHLAVLEGWRAA